MTNVGQKSRASGSVGENTVQFHFSPAVVRRAEPRAWKGKRRFPLRMVEKKRTPDRPTESIKLGISCLGPHRHRFQVVFVTVQVPVDLSYGSWDSVIPTTSCFPDFHFGGSSI